MATKAFLGIWFMLVVIHHVHAQLGCTDPQANNFDPLATLNDGSCQYSPSNYSPILIQNLAPSIVENSGLIVWNNFIWTINDSGSLPEIFKLDLLGNVIDTILVANATNVDWEALTQSNTDLYIGDFGNNAGNRTDLSIYQISKQALISGQSSTIQAQKRVFKYSDQMAFNLPVNGHSFDAEAFYFQNDSLVLFSKNWNDLYTKRYRFPAFWNDTLIISPLDSMFVDGLITDVSIDTASNRVFALGYKNNGSNFYTSFIYLFFDFNESSVFSGNKRRIEIGNMLNLSQTEGLALKDSTSGFISSEKIVSVITIDPKLFSFDFSSFFTNAAGIDELEIDKLDFYPNPTMDYILIDKEYLGCALWLKDMQGTIVKYIPKIEELKISLADINPGVYVLNLNNKCLKLVKI